MKKGKRTLSLAMSILSIATLAGCDKSDYVYPDASWKDGVIVNVGGKNYEYKDVYKLLDETKGSAQAYYNVAKDILAQLVTPRTSTILSTVDSKINDLKNKWKTDARTNSTSYKEEMEKTLDSEKVETVEELRDKYIAQEQNTQNANAFYDINADGTTDKNYKFYISEEMTKNYVTNQAPYHVSHILVKVDASADGYSLWDGKISADDSRQIGNVVRMLSSADSFGSIAQIASDDTGSAKLYGELYTSGDGSAQIAMEKTTSYVNEFKLGLYAYDAFLNPETKNDDAVRASLRVPGKAVSANGFDYKNETSVAETINNTLIGKKQAFGIPLSECFTMGYVADIEKNTVNGNSVDFASETQYPRNILFNNYFNYHGVNFIYDDSADYDAEFLADAKKVGEVAKKTINSLEDVKNELPKKYAEYEYVKAQLENISSDKFVAVDGISDSLVNYDTTGSTTTFKSVGNGKKILVDEKQNPIVVTRAGADSYQGIHFIVVNNDPFEDAQNKYKYYRTNVPKNGDVSDGADTKDYSKNPSFINFVQPDNNTNTTYNTRRDTLTKVIKASDSNMEFNLWDSNIKKFNAAHPDYTFDKVLGEHAAIINQYIATVRKGSAVTNENNLDSSWETYIDKLTVQEQVSPRGIVPEVCVSAFEGGSFDGMEDLCHVKK